MRDELKEKITNLNVCNTQLNNAIYGIKLGGFLSDKNLKDIMQLIDEYCDKRMDEARKNGIVEYAKTYKETLENMDKETK